VNRKLIVTLSLVVVLACGSPPTPTPQPTIDVMQAIAFTQTAAAPLPTNTLITIPTETLTSVLINTATSASTIETPTLVPTLVQVIFTPTQAPAAGPCGCSSDSLNCTDFSGSHARAQACYDYCVSQGRGDIHRLDNDGDGDACESL
jgi:hypothetical protein